LSPAIIEQEQRRLGGERAGQLDALALGQRETGGERRRLRAEAQPLDHATGTRAGLGRVRVAGERADQHVVQHGEARERPHDLERPRQTESADRVRLEAEHRAAAEADLAGIGREEPGEEIERGRLAGAVRADETDHLAFGDVEVERGHGLDTTEALGDAARLEQAHGVVSVRRRNARASRGEAPSGRNSTTAMSSAP
jgi:hypothetical protein